MRDTWEPWFMGGSKSKWGLMNETKCEVLPQKSSRCELHQDEIQCRWLGLSPSYTGRGGSTLPTASQEVWMHITCKALRVARDLEQSLSLERPVQRSSS